MKTKQQRCSKTDWKPWTRTGRNKAGPHKEFGNGQGEEKAEKKPSLFGSISGGNITDETIQGSKSRLFRDIEDI